MILHDGHLDGFRVLRLMMESSISFISAGRSLPLPLGVGRLALLSFWRNTVHNKTMHTWNSEPYSRMVSNK